jgi:hypothetical protein
LSAINKQNANGKPPNANDKTANGRSKSKNVKPNALNPLSKKVRPRRKKSAENRIRTKRKKATDKFSVSSNGTDKTQYLSRKRRRALCNKYARADVFFCGRFSGCPMRIGAGFFRRPKKNFFSSLNLVVDYFATDKNHKRYRAIKNVQSKMCVRFSSRVFAPLL